MDSKTEYFIEQTNKKLDKIEHKIDQLISFRIMLIGASLAVSAIGTTALNLFMNVWK
jgi:hypothetical protein